MRTEATDTEGVHPATADTRVAIDAPPEVTDALATIGRTEDVCFSPDGRRLAITAFTEHLVVLVDIEPAGPVVRCTGVTKVRASGLAAPHGVAFLDDATIVVANREGRVTVHPLPDPGAGAEVRVATLQDDDLGGLRAPGSARLGRTPDGAVTVTVCDNGAGVVTRHGITRGAAGVRLGPGTPLLRRWLDIPDGVAHSADGAWIAVSNHNTQSVLVYPGFAGPDEDRVPVAVLRGVTYPHGLAFLPDGRHLVVADAGRPHVHVFARDADGWSGVAFPVASHRIMDDETFLRGRPSAQEGGPKGLDVDASGRLVAVTSLLRPLELLSSEALLADPGEAGPARRLDAEHARHEHEAGRDDVIAEAIFRAAAEAHRADEADRRATAAEVRAAEAQVRAAAAERRRREAVAQAEAYEQTLTMRLTRPARRLYGRLRRRGRAAPPPTASDSPPHPDDEGHSP